MKPIRLKVQMLGTFSISYGDVVVSANSKRSRKTWLLLAYLLHNNNRIVTQEELIRILWDEHEEKEASGAFNTMLWRARQALNPITSLLGENLIVRKKDGCMWNPDVPMEMDTAQLEALYQKGRSSDDEGVRLEEYRTALSLYQGDFLSNFPTDAWINMVSVYYRNIYLGILLEILPFLLEREHFAEVEELSHAALRTDPYNETIYQYLLRSLLGKKAYKEAAAAYERLRECLSSQLGISPSDETQQIYREIQKHSSQYAISPALIREQLREDTPIAGAIVCDYSYFKFFYQAEARSALRRGDAVHVAVLSLTDSDGNELAPRSLERAMENLRVQLQRSLRKSDVVSRCSESQFVVLLLQANYENSCMVCERVIQAFNRTYPHSPAQINYVVMPLDPIPSF